MHASKQTKPKQKTTKPQPKQAKPLSLYDPDQKLADGLDTLAAVLSHYFQMHVSRSQAAGKAFTETLERYLNASGLPADQLPKLIERWKNNQ